MDSVLIVGCGDIGRRVAARCRARGHSVTGLVRRADGARRLAARGIEPVVADLDTPAQLPCLPADGATVFYFAPPPSTGEDDPRVAGFLQALGDSRPAKLVYISTSAVYGDCGGAWITEAQPVNPGSARGRRRLAAERALQAWGGHTGVPVIILRVPGIYAIDRLPAARLRKGLPVLREQDSPFTNRIHADDLAAVCVAAAARAPAGAVYNVSDGHPTTMCDYFNRVADHLGLARPPQVDRETARQVLSPGMLSFMEESKRLDNRKVLAELRVTLRYPDLAAGLTEPSC